MPRLRIIKDGKFRCSRCKNFFLKEDFQEDKKRRYGIKSFCKNCHKAYGREYYLRPDVKLKHNQQARNNRQELRKQVFLVLGSKCVKCGYSDIRALQIDHINGGGSKETKNMNADKYYRMILELKDKTKYQTLCANCNWIKREEDYARTKS